MRESEGRRRQILVPKPPSSAPAAGSLNLTLRRKAARQIDKDNKVLLDRLIRIGPTVSDRAALASRYEVYTTLVKRHSRLRRTVSKADVFRTPPPPIREPRFRKPKRATAEAPLLPLPAVDKSSKEVRQAQEPAVEDSRPETPEPLRSARKAAQKELDLVGQHVLSKLNETADASGTQTRAETLGNATYSDLGFDGSDTEPVEAARGDEQEGEALSGTPEPIRSAKKAAHNELELVEKKVLKKMYPESTDANAAVDPGASFGGDATYSDFEGSDAGEVQARNEESDYEDDCEADDAYSDTFEVEDADQPEVAWSSVAAAVAAAESNDAAESNSNSPAAPAAAESGSGRSPPAPVADSEPSECDEYSEPEEDSPKLELELESEEEPENLVEAEASDDGRDTDSYGSYYAPSEASNANPKSEGGSIASYDDDNIFEEDSGPSLHAPDSP